MLLEGYSLLVAFRSVQTGAEVAGVPFIEYVRRGTDPTSVAVMLEDAGAVAGLVIAGASDAEDLHHMTHVHLVAYSWRPPTRNRLLSVSQFLHSMF